MFIFILFLIYSLATYFNWYNIKVFIKHAINFKSASKVNYSSKIYSQYLLNDGTYIGYNKLDKVITDLQNNAHIKLMSISGFWLYIYFSISLK